MEVLPSETIVVPIDFTEPSLNALATAVSLSQQQKTGIRLVYVLDSDAIKAITSNGHLSDLSPEQLMQEGNSSIQSLANQTAQDHHIQCSGSVCMGNYPDEVVATATSIHAELIVLGCTHSGSDIQAFRINSEVYQVAKTALCPVLTVPDHQKWANFERILFPVRPIPGALHKYEFARKIIRREEAELTVLALFAPDEIISLQELQDEITGFNVILAQDGVRSQSLFCPTDSIAETVLEKTIELKADLLVITASLGINADNFFTGPFTQQIIHNARVPVLSIRPESGMEQMPRRISWLYGQTDQGLAALGL